MKAKIIHITQASGGVKTFILNIFKASNIELEHILISSDRDFCDEVEKLKRNNKFYFVKMTRGLSLFIDIYSLIRIFVIVNKEKPCIIHCHSAKGGAIGRIVSLFTNTKCVFTPNAFSYIGFVGFRYKFYLGIEKFLKKFTTLLLAVSESERLRAKNEVGYKDNKIQVVPNSIFVKKKDLKKHDEITIGMIGRLTFQKNPIEYIKLANEIKLKGFNIRFILKGAGYHDYLREEVNELITKLNIQDIIEIESWDKSMSVENFYNTIDIFILTSRFEGLPFSLLESMSYKVPSIVSNVDGNKDVISHGYDGFVYNSFEELVKFTELLIKDVGYRLNMGDNAHKTIDSKFNIEKNIFMIDKLYFNLAN